MLRAAGSSSSGRPSRSGFVEQLERIERFERLEHTRARRAFVVRVFFFATSEAESL